MTGRPPPLATRLLQWLLPEHNRDAIVGDLAEEYGLRLQWEPRGLALRWYWSQVFRSAPQVLWSSAVRDSWHVSLAIALAAFFAVGFVQWGLFSLLPALVSKDSFAFAPASLALSLGTMVGAGYLAAGIRPAASLLLALLVATSIAAGMAAAGNESEFWIHSLFLFLCPVAALAGRRLRLRKRI